MIFANSSSLLWSVRRAQVVFIGLLTKTISPRGDLTTAHAQLTRGRQEALILGPKVNDSLGHVDRDFPPLSRQIKKPGLYSEKW